MDPEESTAGATRKRQSGVTRVLVTGGAGFIGSHLCEALWESGHDVVVLDDLSRGRNENLQSFSSRERFTLVNGKVTDPELVERVAADCHAIYHLAASIGNPDNPRVDLDTNVVGTFNVLEAARHSSLRPPVVYASTNKVYSDLVNDIPVSEEETRFAIAEAEFGQGIGEDFDVAIGRHGLYGLSKLTGEHFVREYAHLYKVRTGVFRQSTIYGPRDRGGWVSAVIRSALRRGAVKTFGGGKQLRDVLYVTDLVQAYMAFADNASVGAGVWNVGGGPKCTLSILELVEMIARVTDKSLGVEDHPSPPYDQKVFIADIRRLQEDLGWIPGVDAETGIRRTIEFIQEEEEHSDRAPA